jgi:UDP-N-acetylmuramoyl-L-alanyl-D-glutamate--2,6-diaminopimelate ligase
VAALVESARMDLVQLGEGIAGARLLGDPATPVRGIAYHTRDVGPGTLFCCVPGFHSDGHDFAFAAVAAGATAVMCERDLDVDAARLVVPSVRRAMPLVAARFYGFPSRELTVVGVTGTNGKTTSAHLVSRIFAAAGVPAGLLGTVGSRIGGEAVPIDLTTPESPDLQALLRRMVTAGDRACVMEASSHALVLGRVAQIDYAVAAFTNLSREHLDFHRDIEDYFAAKRRLFFPQDGPRPRVAVVNQADAWGVRLADACRPAYGDALWTFAVDDADVGGGAVSATGADVLAADVTLGADGSSFTLRVPRLGVETRLTIRLAARFNVENALCAATVALGSGLPADAVRAGLEAAEGVPGRFEAVRAGQPFTVLVDYSHTPDSLESALRAAATVASGRVLVVFGCGGDRDRGKRPVMGEIAARLAARAVVTSDNPRSEDPDAIIAEIVAGVPSEARARLAVEPDRRAAIALAFEAAGPGDVVVIAGKGHEQGQLVGDRRLPFDDRSVAAELLGALGWEAGA